MNDLFNILVVDDERSNLDVLIHILKPDYNVLVAKSGQAALKRARENKPDLILLDIVMPDMTGFEVLAQLMDDDDTRDIPVIFITGLARVADEEKGFLLGAVDYIVKPFNTSIVKARVKTHLKIVKQMRTIEKLGMIDALTDIPNRRSFDHQMDVEWRKAVRDRTVMSFIMIDADKFKVYNDTYGHPQGDVLLQTLAETMVKTLKRPSDFAARLGGEEFAVILPDTDLEAALSIAESIRANVEAMEIPGTGDAANTSITVSVGVATISPTPDDSPAEFIAKADAALYTAKNSGRNRVHHH